jgi:hypothetical protein
MVACLWSGLAGSLLGTRLNRSVSPDVLFAAFAVVMMIAVRRRWVRARWQDRIATAAAAAHKRCPSCAPADENRPDPASLSPSDNAGVDDHPTVTRGSEDGLRMSTVAKVVVAGSMVGLMTGFFGVGAQADVSLPRRWGRRRDRGRCRRLRSAVPAADALAGPIDKLS